MIDISQSATHQIDALASGEVSSADLLEAYIAQYRRINGSLNAVVRVDLASARAAAKAIDERRAAGKPIGALQGLPITIKDSLDVNGMPATCGVPALKDRALAVADADVVARIKRADGVIWGKTNTPLMAGDVQTYNKVFGVTNHPTDPSRSPGGSSGGAAAAVATYMTATEIGSDIGGSLRTPAHYCGICTLKPTFDLLSLAGHVPPSPSGQLHVPPDLAVVGPLARTVTDLRLVMEILTEGAISASPTLSGLDKVRVAVWLDEPGFPLSAACRAAVTQVRQVLVSSGAHTEAATPDIDMQEMLDTYLGILFPIVLSELPALPKTVFRTLRPLFSVLNGKQRYSFLNAVMNGVAKEPVVEAHRHKRNEMKEACDDFFKTHDVLIAPVTPTLALPHNNKGLPYGRKMDLDGKPVPYFHQLDWIALATLCHLPAAVIPVPNDGEALPVGIQIIGKEGADAKVLEIAELLEKALRRS